MLEGSSFRLPVLKKIILGMPFAIFIFFLFLGNGVYASSNTDSMTVPVQGTNPAVSYYSNNESGGSSTNSINGTSGGFNNNSTTSVKFGNFTAWKQYMSKIPTHHAGCYSAKYPSTVWETTPCTTAPLVPLKPSPLPKPHNPAQPNQVGAGLDISAQAPANSLITFSGGFFEPVAPLTGETDSMTTGQNDFSLQINPQFFGAVSTPSTDYHSGYSSSWEQFVMYNSQSQNFAMIFMEYWLYNYALVYGGCPVNNPPDSSSAWIKSGSDCWLVSKAENVPLQTVSNLANISLMGGIDSGYDNQGNYGIFDDVTFCDSTTNSCKQVITTDNVVNLSRFWNTAEFNIFGAGDGSTANFDPGTGIIVHTITQSYEGFKFNPVTCSVNGFTAETNNLNLTPYNWYWDPPYSVEERCHSDNNGNLEFFETNTPYPIAGLLTTGVASGNGFVRPFCPSHAIVNGCIAFSGQQVTVKATPSLGWKFSNWYADGISPCSTSTCAFTMPSTGVDLEANFVNVGGVPSTHLTPFDICDQNPRSCFGIPNEIYICDLVPNPCYEADFPWSFIISPLPPPPEQISTLPLVVYLHQAVYDHNSPIPIYGHVNNAYTDQDVALEIFDPSGNIVTVSQTAVDNNGKFTTTINTASPLMSKNGVYTIYAQQGDQQGRTYQIQFVLASAVPEFGSVIGIILVLAIIGVLVISRKLNFVPF